MEKREIDRKKRKMEKSVCVFEREREREEINREKKRNAGARGKYRNKDRKEIE
jgi:hypothetical protein